MDENSYFIKALKCPVCKNNIETIVIKSSGTRLVKRDEDFCAHFEPINRTLYDVWICSECGYAAMSDKFESIPEKDIQVIKKEIGDKWVKRDFDGERTTEKAIEIFKIALLNLQKINSKSIDFAKVCIRIAWFYRFMGDNENENIFLKYALDNYMNVYQTEKFPVDKMDERTCMYMIGELNRRLGENKEAAKWFFNVITYKNKNESEKEKARSKAIVNMARDQLQVVKEKNE